MRALETDHDGSPVDRSHARGVALLVATAVQTGLRVDELRHLRACDISDDAVSVRAHGTWRPKDREERTIPLAPEALTVVRRYLAAAVRAAAAGLRADLRRAAEGLSRRAAAMALGVGDGAWGRWIGRGGWLS